VGDWLLLYIFVCVLLLVVDLNSCLGVCPCIRLLKHATNLLPREYTIDKKFEDYFFSITRRKKTVYFVKTDEIGTEKGHVLIIGYRGKLPSKNLNLLLREAHKQKCIIIANHPLHKFGIPYFFVSKIINTGKISLKKKDLEKHKRQFDALELSSYFPEDWKEIRSFSKKNNLQIVSDSDAHSLDEIFTSYYEIPKLSFASPKKFKKSLKKALKKRIKLHARQYGFLAEYKHGIQVLLGMIGNRLGVIKK